MIGRYITRLVTVGFILLLVAFPGCSAKRERMFVTGLFPTHAAMDAAFRKLQEQHALFIAKKRGRLSEKEVREAGFTPYREKTNGEEMEMERVDNVNVFEGHKAFDEYFGKELNMFDRVTPVQLADEKNLWLYEAYLDERIGGDEPFIYLNTEENNQKEVKTWFVFVIRRNPETGIREVVDLSKDDTPRKGNDSVSAPGLAIIGGMGRLVGGATQGLSKGL